MGLFGHRGRGTGRLPSATLGHQGTISACQPPPPCHTSHVTGLWVRWSKAGQGKLKVCLASRDAADDKQHDFCIPHSGGGGGQLSVHFVGMRLLDRKIAGRTSRGRGETTKQQHCHGHSHSHCNQARSPSASKKARCDIQPMTVSQVANPHPHLPNDAIPTENPVDHHESL